LHLVLPVSLGHIHIGVSEWSSDILSLQHEQKAFPVEFGLLLLGLDGKGINSSLWVNHWVSQVILPVKLLNYVVVHRQWQP
jgi:hypothetical protein